MYQISALYMPQIQMKFYNKNKRHFTIIKKKFIGMKEFEREKNKGSNQ